MKITFSTFSYWPGVVSCLENIKKIIQEKYPQANIISRNFDSPNLSFSTIKELKINPPDILFVGGWDNRIKTIVQNTSPRTKVILMWCSPITQVELGGEMTRFFDVWNCLDTKQIDYLAIPLETDYESLKLLNDRTVYFPIYMDTKELDENKISEKETNNKLIVDMFCAPCLRKNILTQMVALAHHKDKTLLRINYSPSSSNSSLYIDAAHRIVGNYENNEWLDRSLYLNKIQNSDFCMQVSLSESFNYVAAEHMYYGIPAILSDIIPYASDPRISGLVVENHQNIYEISRVIGRLCNEQFRLEMKESCHKAIVDYNNNSKEVLTESLEKILRG